MERLQGLVRRHPGPERVEPALAVELTDAIQRKLETRAYLPHITLARFGRSAGPIGGLLTRSGGVSSPSYPISEFCLYESKLSHEGSIYTIVERYSLD
jgi:2'-5' RNA ligase